MCGGRWVPEGPPEEAYERLTDPERFAPLHKFAVGLADWLEASFDVERVEGYGLDSKVERKDAARSSIRLIPRNDDAAPITVSSTTFPGLSVRLGRWYTDSFPTCGCDACDETAEGERERLENLVEAVTAGRFREALGRSFMRKAWAETSFWGPWGMTKQRPVLRLDRDPTRRTLAGRAVGGASSGSSGCTGDSRPRPALFRELPGWP